MATVNLKMRDGTTEEKECTLVAGLAVHKAGFANDLWNVTHAASGLSLGDCTFLKKSHAIKFAKEVAALYDTTTGAEELIQQSRNRGSKTSIAELATRNGSI